MDDRLFLTGDTSAVDALRAAADTLLDALDRWHTPAEGPWSGVDPAVLAAMVEALEVCPDEGMGVERALADLGPAVLAHAVHPSHPATMAHLHSPTLLSAAAAEMVIGATNQSMDSFDQAPAATLVEDRLVRWLAALTGLPAGASGVITAGGSASNVLALLLARRHAAARDGVDVDRDGVAAIAAGRWRVLTSAASHVSIAQAGSVLGIGHRHVVAVATDAGGRMDLDALDQRLAEIAAQGAVPMAIVGTAGTTDTGAIDPLAELARRARATGTWLHVDAAVGAGLLLSRRLAPRLAGIGAADSVTADLHKLWWQPISASALLVADPASFAGMRRRDDYLNRVDDDGDGLLNLVTRSLDTSRRFDAFKVLVALRATGRRQMGAMVERVVDLTATATTMIAQNAALQLVATGPTVMVAFRWVGAGEHTDDALDHINTALQRELFRTGAALVGRTRLDGRVALKLTLVNPLQTERGIADVLAAVCRTGAALAEH